MLLSGRDNQEDNPPPNLPILSLLNAAAAKMYPPPGHLAGRALRMSRFSGNL